MDELLSSRKLHVPFVPAAWLPEAAVAALCFSASSIAMTILNKAVLSSFLFSAPTCFLLFQCSCTVVLVLASGMVGVARLQPASAELLRTWVPVNVLFVAMLWTSFGALKYMSVPMVTVLKNMTSFLVILGELYLFRVRHPLQIWLCLCLMVASALAGAATDLTFHAGGYLWQALNCCTTAAYSLMLRSVMQRSGSKGARLDEYSMVLYNNLLALPCISVLCVLVGEHRTLLRQQALYSLPFQLAALASAVTSFCISVSAMWLAVCTSATVFNLIGSLNRIPTAVLGMLLFHVPVCASNLTSVAIALLASVLFAQAKVKKVA